MNKKTCKICKWWEKPDEARVRQASPFLAKGECRKKRPSIVVMSKDTSADFMKYAVMTSYSKTKWPEVYFNEWCGEFEPKSIKASRKEL